MFGRFAKSKPRGERGEEVPEPHDGLPDSNRLGGLCPRCGKQSSFAIAGTLPVTFESSYALNHDGTREPQVLDQVASLICRHCRHGVVVVEEKWIGDHPARDGLKEGGPISFRGIHWWPLPETNLSSDISSDVAAAFAEAALALHAGCPRASAVMARRTLEAVTVDKGETSGNLAARLKSLASRGVLHPSLAAWAAEIRLVGNIGAHYDLMNPVSREDAQQLLSFTRELLRYLYELPADLARRRGDQGTNR